MGASIEAGNRWIRITRESLFFVGVLLVLLEIFCRVMGLGRPLEALRVDTVIPGPEGVMERTDFGYIPQATVVSEYASDPRGYFGPGNRVSHGHNALGLRDELHPVAKPEGELRILGLGDSYLWGQGVRTEDLLLTRLEVELEGDFPGTLQTVNTAVPSMNTWWQLASLKDQGLAYAPDLVTLFFVANDVEDQVWDQGQQVEAFRAYTLMAFEEDALSRWSRLWRFVRGQYIRFVQGRRFIEDRMGHFQPDSDQWRSCQTALLQMKERLDQEDIPFLLVILPIFFQLDDDYPFQSIHDVVSEYATSIGIEVLDLRSAFPGYSGPELWVHPTDHHPNEIAHRLAAKAVADHIREHPALLGGD